MTLVQPRRSAGTPTGGQWEPLTRPEGEANLGVELTVLDNQGESCTIRTSSFDATAHDVFKFGQCAALAAALATEYPELEIKVLSNYSGSVLIHAWCQLPDDDQVIDAGTAFGDYLTVDEVLDDAMYNFHTGEDCIETLTVDELRAKFVGQPIPNPQDWAAAAAMIPAWSSRAGW